MASLVALFDSCVLYPAPLRDLLMHLALSDSFHAKWTHAIHDEWIRNVLANRKDLSIAQLERTRNLMNSHVRDCLVEGYETLIPALSLPDRKDRHVLAAAIRASASVIVTYNLKDFPQISIKEYGIEAQHPDDFLGRLFDSSPQMFCRSVQRLRLSLKNPPMDIENYLAILKQQSLLQTSQKLQEFIKFI